MGSSSFNLQSAKEDSFPALSTLLHLSLRGGWAGKKLFLERNFLSLSAHARSFQKSFQSVLGKVSCRPETFPPSGTLSSRRKVIAAWALHAAGFPPSGRSYTIHVGAKAPGKAVPADTRFQALLLVPAGNTFSGTNAPTPGVSPDPYRRGGIRCKDLGTWL